MQGTGPRGGQTASSQEPAGQAGTVWRGGAWVSVPLLARVSLVAFVPAQPGPLLSLDHVPKNADLDWPGFISSPHSCLLRSFLSSTYLHCFLLHWWFPQCAWVLWRCLSCPLWDRKVTVRGHRQGATSPAFPVVLKLQIRFCLEIKRTLSPTKRTEGSRRWWL